MNTLQALQTFWSSFDLPAFDENTVPDNTALPYITYEGANDYFGTTLPLSASIWYRSASWADITAKENEIAEYIGRGGKQIACEGGALWIKRGQPWAQRMNDPADGMIRRIVLNIEIDFLT